MNSAEPLPDGANLPSPGAPRERPTARPRARLERTLASLCRGGTLVLGTDAPRLAEALAASGTARPRAADSQHAPVQALRAAGAERFRTVVLAETLPDDPDQARALLDEAFRTVRNGGRLVVLVPHARAGEAPGARRRRELERLLRPLGKPKLVSEQPYRWLLMYVKKPAPGAPPFSPSVAERYRIIAGLCRGSVLELGCGPGHLAAEIAAAGHVVAGMDLNHAKVAEAAARYPHIAFQQGDAATLSVARAFDTVVIAEVLEHVDSGTGDRILSAARRALRPGGRLLVSVPNEKCIPHPNHVRLFDERVLRELLRAFGTPRSSVDQPFKWLLMYVDVDE